EKAFFSALHRVEMLKKATENTPDFVVNDLELTRQGKSYTIDTIKQLQLDFPNHDFYFIIGGDMVEYLPKWEKIDELMQLVYFVGVTRPSYTLHTKYPIIRVEIPSMGISSSFIRK